MTEENYEKTTVRLVGTGIRTRDLPNASLVLYHGGTSLGNIATMFHTIFFYSLLFRDASTYWSYRVLGSLGMYQKAVYFNCCVVNVSIVKFTD